MIEIDNVFVFFLFQESPVTRVTRWLTTMEKSSPVNIQQHSSTQLEDDDENPFSVYSDIVSSHG